MRPRERQLLRRSIRIILWLAFTAFPMMAYRVSPRWIWFAIVLSFIGQALHETLDLAVFIVNMFVTPSGS